MVRVGVTSYRQLPVTLYQIQTKFRDEIRPRFGLMRGREFLMKDAYSFDATPRGSTAPTRRRTPPTGGSSSAAASTSRSSRPTPARSAARVAGVHGARRHGRGRGRALRRLRLRREPREGRDGRARRRPGRTRPRRRSSRSPTPGKGGSTTSSTFLGITAGADHQDPGLRDRAGLRRGAAPRRPRGQRGRAEERARRRALALASEEKVEQATGRAGRLRRAAKLPGRGPARRRRIVRDAVNAVTGAGRRDWHVAGFVLRARREGRRSGRVFAQARAGDPCPRCGKPLDDRARHRGRPHLQARHKYSEAMSCEFTDEKGETQPIVMGCYGIGIGRTMAAAIEQNHDADGIIWPLPLAPFEIALVSLNPADEATAAGGRRARRRARRGRHRRLLRRPRRAAGREVQGRRPDRLPDPRQRRRPGAQGGQGRDRPAPRQERARGRRRRGGRGRRGAPRASSPGGRPA